MNTKEKEEAKTFIENGGKCQFRFGYAWKGAGARPLTKEQALEKLPKFNFGMGFYELDWMEVNGERVLEFNELGENDLW